MDSNNSRISLNQMKTGELESLMVLARATEYRDREMSNHIYRVAAYSRMLAREAGMTASFQEAIYYAAPLHDVGKIGIPDSILFKDGPLLEQEYSIMKSHTLIGHEILKNTNNPYLQMSSVIALYHHEWFNGQGYPGGLKGDAIPIEGRITAVADVFDALVSTRRYKSSWSFDAAMSYLMRERGSHFDPDLVDLFEKNSKEIEHIQRELPDNSVSF